MATGRIEWREDTVKYITDCFNEIATDGKINADQLEQCLMVTGLDPTTYKLDWLIKHFDKNNDGKLDVDELMENLPILHAHSVQVNELKAAFQFFDKNGDGYIRLPELKTLLSGCFMNPIEAGRVIDELVREFDRDRDGKFNYAEFMDAYWTKREKFMYGDFDMMHLDNSQSQHHGDFEQQSQQKL